MKSLKVFALVIVMANVSAAQKEVPLPKDLPAYAAEQPLQAPNVRSSKLDNGLTVWLVSQPGLPKVAFAAAVRGGFAADPADRPGITELLSKTIDQGTKSRTAKQISQELQAAGGDLSVESSKDFIQIQSS
jgi:zinc protease